MSVGWAATKNDWDQRAGALAAQLRDVLAGIQRFEALLLATPDANLTALGYVAGEVATLKSAFADLDKLRQIYEGTATQASTYDFRTFAKQLTGVV